MCQPPPVSVPFSLAVPVVVVGKAEAPSDDGKKVTVAVLSVEPWMSTRRASTMVGRG